MSVEIIADEAIKRGKKILFVGGAVRDFIMLGDDPFDAKDIDLAINMPVLEVRDMLEGIGAKVITKYATNITVFRGKTYEITSTRKDINCDGRYADMIFTDSFEEDSMRRDFTINALYMDFDGTIYDYNGGIDDAKNGVVRFIGNPLFRITEDYLRIWRFFRFSALYAKNLDQVGLDACIKKKEGLLHLSKERATYECKKMLSSHRAFEFLEIMTKNNIINNINTKEVMGLEMENRFFYITFSQMREDLFCYTREQKRFLSGFSSFLNEVCEGGEPSRLKLKVLSYLIEIDRFHKYCNLANALYESKIFYDFQFYERKALPFSLNQIAKSFSGNDIKKEFIRELYKFLSDCKF